MAKKKLPAALKAHQFKKKPGGAKKNTGSRIAARAAPANRRTNRETTRVLRP
jgi:hypothetical protein